MNLLPAETTLDIFKCLNFNQLNNIQQSNRHFCELIINYNKELAMKVFYSVELVVWKNYVCKELEYNPNELDFDLGEEGELKWKTAIQERIHNYHYYKKYSSRIYFDVAIGDYKMNEIANLFLVSKETDGKSPKILRLQLKQYPDTIEEMIVFRFWLKKLSHCFIENFKIEQGYINPEIIELFFGDSPLKFHTNSLYLYDEDTYSFPKGYQFLYHHVVIHGDKGFYYENSGWKLRGEMIKDEECHFLRAEEEVEDFCKVAEYEFFGVNNPQEHVMLYLCFHVGSKQPYYSEVRRIDIV
uniref:F-box domain-containing protein n=1 Tax=Meloidogyne enterolobii TaxID=390850 RepID=A0A6V7TNF6_MELEN|nr:unnamed protein product [Meloidogyne enterolobii]